LETEQGAAFRAGSLRLGELLNVREDDVLFDRKCIFVKADKEKKDRYTLLANHMENASNAYPKAYKPLYGLFEGPTAEPYSARSVQVVLRKAVAKARPNPAMQRMLGQKACKTTELHTHESTQGVPQIKSPFDDWEWQKNLYFAQEICATK
jgi:integrase/recombinase XerD